MALGRRGEARRLLEQALELRRAVAGDDSAAGISLYYLAKMAREDGDLARAAELQGRALEIRRARQPGTRWLVESLHEMGRIERARGNLAAARTCYLEALDALDAQVRTLGGGDETKSRFRGYFSELSSEAVDLLLDLKRPDEAFGVLERSRARAFLALLAGRDLDFGPKSRPPSRSGGGSSRPTRRGSAPPSRAPTPGRGARRRRSDSGPASGRSGSSRRR